MPVGQFCSGTGISEKDIGKKLVDGLLAEALCRAEQFDIENWNTIYIGGGTPSLLSPENLERLMQGLFLIRPAARCAEITAEANPEDINPLWLDAACAAGINRLSVGIQSLQDTSLTYCARRGSRAASLDALALLRSRWTARGGRLSCDLIAGLPEQKETELLADIRELLAYNPGHISLYSLMIEKQTPLARSLSGKKQTALLEKADDLWLSGRRLLKESGYIQYEVSNFAAPLFSGAPAVCAHNLAYWNMEAYMGIGPGAVGSFPAEQLPGRIRGTGSSAALRFSDTTDIQKWLADPCAMPEIEYIDLNTFLFEYLMMGFRKAAGISRSEFERRFGFALEKVIEPAYSRWKEKGLAQDIPSAADILPSAALTADGLLFLNRFLEELM